MAVPTAEHDPRTGRDYRAALHQTEARLRTLARRLREANRRLRQANHALRQLASTDPLTGVANRRELDDRLQIELRRAARSGAPLSLLFLDVDHFKAYNDRFGHPAGDEALVRLGALLCQAVRTSDEVARFGGEEFVIVLPDTDEEGARTLAEKVRARVGAGMVGAGPMTASIGVATCRLVRGRGADYRMEARRLLAAADRALYEAKRAGRDRVVHRIEVAAPR